MKFYVISEEDWKARRQRRISRYGKVFQGRIAPGFKPGASDKEHSKAWKSYKRVQKSAQKWSARGVKGGAGGKIRSDDAYMTKLVGHYAKKKESFHHDPDAFVRLLAGW